MEDWKKKIDDYSKKHFAQSDYSLQRDEKQFIKNFEQYWGKDYLNLILSLGSIKNADEYNNLIDNVKKFLTDKREFFSFRFKKIEQERFPRYQKITTSQIRNVLAKIKPIADEKEIITIRPVLAYTAGRATNDEIKEIMFLFEQLVKKIKTKEHLESFKDFVEAIISYHRYLGGK